VEAARTAAAAFISCRLDYCNSLLFGLRKLQSVQSATAHDAMIISRQYYVNCTGYPSERASSSKWHAWFASRCLDRRLSTWQMTALLFLTAHNAHCGQRTFWLAWCHESTQLLRWQNFCSRRTPPVELSSSSTTQSRHHLRTVQTTAEGTPFSGSMNTVALCDFDMRRRRRTLTYLLTYSHSSSVFASVR